MASRGRCFASHTVIEYADRSPRIRAYRFGSRVRAWLAIEVRWATPRLAVRASLPALPAVITWVKRLTKTKRLRKS
jgi:hypothetical protein